MRDLKSSTAFVVCLALATPTQTLAQSRDGTFPCVSPAGEQVQDTTALGQSLLAFLAADASVASEEPSSGDVAFCATDAIDAAIEEGGDEMAAAIAAAPADRLAALNGPVEGASGAAEAAEVPDEQAVQSEPVEEATAEPAPATESSEAEAESEPVAETEVEAAPEATEDAANVEAEENAEPVEAETVETEAAEPEAPIEAEPAAEVAAEASEQAETEPADARSAEAAENEPSDVAVAEPAAPEVAPEVATEEATAEATDAADEPEQSAETETIEAEEPAVETPKVTAGEADGEQLTDAERQEIAQAREEESEPAPAAAAAAADADGGDEAMAEAEVETQTVSEDDVRSSSEDFETSASGNKEAEATLANDDDEKGLSNFEKALILGVGAAVVGSILKNGDEVVSNSGDRVVVERDGELRVLKNDDELLRRPGAEVQTQRFNDGSTRTVVSYEDGSQIITVRASDGTVLRRTLVRAADGSEVVLFDDTVVADPIDFAELPEVETSTELQEDVALDDQDALRLALNRGLVSDIDRTFSLRQVRQYKRVRALAPQIELDALTFATGSAAIQPDQADALRDLGFTIREIIADNPGAVFLVEGHTDAVGSASYNLALSDRRAETVALALTEYFNVPPQNLITQGYGESDLKIRVLTDERANRRAAVRNITGLLY